MKKISLFILFLIYHFFPTNTIELLPIGIHLILSLGSGILENYQNSKYLWTTDYNSTLKNNMHKYLHPNHFQSFQDIFHPHTTIYPLLFIFAPTIVDFLATSLSNGIELKNTNHISNVAITALHGYITNNIIEKKKINDPHEIRVKVQEYIQKKATGECSQFLIDYFVYVITQDAELSVLKPLYDKVFGAENNKNNTLKIIDSLFLKNRKIIEIEEFALLEKILKRDPKHILLDESLKKEIENINTMINLFLENARKVQSSQEKTEKKIESIIFMDNYNHKIILDNYVNKKNTLKECNDLLIQHQAKILFFKKKESDILENIFIQKFIYEYNKTNAIANELEYKNTEGKKLRQILQKNKLYISFQEQNEEKIIEIAKIKTKEIEKFSLPYTQFYETFKEIENNFQEKEKIISYINNIITEHQFRLIDLETNKVNKKEFLYNIKQQNIEKKNKEIEKELIIVQNKKSKLERILIEYKEFLSNKKEIHSIINAIKKIEVFSFINGQTVITEEIKPLENNLELEDIDEVTLSQKKSTYINKSNNQKKNLKKYLTSLQEIERRYQSFNAENQGNEYKMFITKKIKKLKEECDQRHHKDPLGFLEKKIDTIEKEIIEKKELLNCFLLQISQQKSQHIHILEKIEGDEKNEIINTLTSTYKYYTQDVSKWCFSDEYTKNTLSSKIESTNSQLSDKVKEIYSFLLKRQQQKKYQARMKEIENFFAISNQKFSYKNTTLLDTSEKEHFFSADYFFSQSKFKEKNKKKPSLEEEKIIISDAEKAQMTGTCDTLKKLIQLLPLKEKNTLTTLDSKLSIFLERLPTIAYAQDLVEEAELSYLIEHKNELQELLNDKKVNNE